MSDQVTLGGAEAKLKVSKALTEKDLTLPRISMDSPVAEYAMDCGPNKKRDAYFAGRAAWSSESFCCECTYTRCCIPEMAKDGRDDCSDDGCPGF